MCTVSFIARRRGYLLAMNRDEQLARAPGLPPAIILTSGRKVVRPSEPGGGTWIAANDAGLTFALINWYFVKARVQKNPVSRGSIVNCVSAQSSPAAAGKILAGLPLKRTNPFRLIGVFPATKEIVEWRWDLRRLATKNHPWRTQQFISSGFDEPKAQRVRNLIFRLAMRQKTAGTLSWLRRLHRSHTPVRGPFSTCMHRADAATVSCTEVSVSSGGAMMRYHAGAPCQNAECSVLNLELSGMNFGRELTA
jgi:hypothetical protein